MLALQPSEGGHSCNYPLSLVDPLWGAVGVVHCRSDWPGETPSHWESWDMSPETWVSEMLVCGEAEALVGAV